MLESYHFITHPECCFPRVQVQNQCSEFGDERPIAAVAYSPDGSLLASGAWSGLLKLWGAAGCEKQLTVRAHDNRITGAPSPPICTF